MNVRVLLCCLALLSVGALGACEGPEPSPAPIGDDDPMMMEDPEGPDESALSFYEDIKPLLDDKCNKCHVEGGIAPFPLETYEQVKPLAMAIRDSVMSGSMPPWQPEDDCSELLGDFSLSPVQQQDLLDWVEGGVFEGSPENAVPSVADPGGKLTRVDMTLQIPVAYKPQLFPDDYRCFLVEWPEQETRFVTGFKANPDNKSIVHHAIAFVASPEAVGHFEALDEAEEGPGYTCYGGPGGENNLDGVSWLGSWAPGSSNVNFPEGTGIRVEPGSRLIIQMHLNSLSSDPAPDQSSFELRLADEVEREAVILPYTNPAWLRGDGMHIPAGEKSVKHSFGIDVTRFADIVTGGRLSNGPLRIYAAGLHMHTLGVRARTAIRRQGTEECLLSIPEWDFNWQGSYGFAEAKVFNPGDELFLECEWDNSPENQPFVPTDTDGDGEHDAFEQMEPQDVKWGEGTFDEMCLGVLYVTSE